MAINENSGLKPSDILGRELPYSLEAEQAVLGGILIEPTILPKVIEKLKPESFYRPQHQQLFSIMMRMFTNAKTEDIITVINEAVAMGVFETSAMAKTYLSGVMESVPSTANIESYCDIIKEKAQIRSLINIANDIISKNNSFVKMQLYTDNEGGNKAEYYRADSNYGEVLHIISEIKKLKSLN